MKYWKEDSLVVFAAMVVEDEIIVGHSDWQRNAVFVCETQKLISTESVVDFANGVERIWVSNKEELLRRANEAALERQGSKLNVG